MKKIATVFEIFKKNNPNPTTELVYNSHFELLIAVVLSAQATDISVNKATKELFKIANTPEQILKLGISGLETYIKSIGLYRTKARNIINLCNQLIEQHNYKVPETFDELIKLSGVGRKTANVILNTLHGEHLVAVDTHVFRVSNRLGIATGKTPLEVEKKLLTNIPKQYLANAHHWLILHGRYICKAKNPLCDSCIMNRYCDYYNTKINPTKKV
ncbi:MAG: endonuclease III [Neisseriaceae bacterium]